jgi:transcriptional regulator
VHPNPSFRKASTDQNLTFARDRGFGILAANGADSPILAHVPFLMSDDGCFADLHLARSNGLVGFQGAAVLAVSGPDAYVSPDWYGLPDQVPTWNYIAVHLRGTLEQLPSEALEPHLIALSERFEKQLLPKPIWKPSKMGEGVMDRMMRMILPFRLTIRSVDGTWKLNQNKTAEARLGAIAGLSELGGASAGIATAMRSLPKD